MSWAKPINWTMNRDQEGHREYKITFLVKVNSTSDGPASAMYAAGLPAVGAPWSYGNDYDAYALCWPTFSAKPVLTKEKGLYWEVENTFSTKPLKRCQDETIKNPLDEPQKVSGGFVAYKRTVIKDINGKAIMSSSMEPLDLEKEVPRATVNIEQNVVDLELPLVTEMIDTVNDSELWGLDARCILLRNCTWDRKLWGVCTYYYTRKFEFAIQFESFDEAELLDMGTRCVRGVFYTPPGGGLATWVQDPFADNKNLADYMRVQDIRGNLLKKIPLDGAGGMNTNPVADPKYITPPIQIYPESNFLLLGIPTSF